MLPLVLSVEGCRKAGPGMSMSPYVILYIITSLALARRFTIFALSAGSQLEKNQYLKYR